MEIEFLGLSCFLIKSTGEDGKEIKVLVDPFFEDFEKTPNSLEADILVLSQNKKPPKTKGMPFLIDRAGEYEIRGVFVQGVRSKGNTVYLIETEGISLCYLNSLSKEDITADIMEKIGDIDVLMVSVGGSLGSEEAADVISQIEPRIVLPMDYQIPGLKTKKGKLEDFLKAFGVEKPEILKKLKIKSDRLPEETEVIILEKS